MSKKTKAKPSTKKKRKAKVRAKPKVKKTTKTYGCRVAIYFGKEHLALLKWAKAHAAKTGVGLNRLVVDGLRNVHVLETNDVHYVEKRKGPKPPVPGLDR